MLVSYEWLKQLVPGLSKTPEQLAAALTGAGLAVDGIRPHAHGLFGLVIAEVVAKTRHPSRDKLQLVTVDCGLGDKREIVCGASNVPAPGGRVVFAPTGTHLPAVNLTLEPRKIGGILSAGMLVSERELGLAAESDGILIAEQAAAPGTPFLEAFEYAEDTIFDLDVTPNRSDALGHIGVARELSAIFDLPFSLPEPTYEPAPSGSTLTDLVGVENREPERCPVYGAAVVDQVRIRPSPAWLRWRLHGLGVRPISNVVDITNYLLLLFGQPMHAFDLDRVRGQRIIVRRAEEGERFTTLDGVERQLSNDDLVICDAEAPSALAGVMGGLDSEIQETTTRVLLECAYFSPGPIRRTARRHGLHTESSHRFERGVDHAAVPLVLAHAKALLGQLAFGHAVPGAIYEKGVLPRPAEMKLSSRKLNSLCGAEIPFTEALAILKRLGFEVQAGPETAADRQADVRGTSFRPDVGLDVDLIEEVVRIWNLDRIEPKLPSIKPQRPRHTDDMAQKLAQQAVALGLSEAICYAFVSRAELSALAAPEPVVCLKNPLSEERSVMQTSILPGLLEALGRARRQGEGEIRLFTIGSCFFAPNGKSSSSIRLPGDRALPEECRMLGIVLAGTRREHLALTQKPLDVFDAKGVAFELIERVTRHKPGLIWAETRYGHLHPRGAAEIVVGDCSIGRLGPLHPDVVDTLKLDGPALVIEIDIAKLQQLPVVVPRYKPIPKLPGVTRDVSFVINERVSAERLEHVIVKAAGAMCESVELLAEYVGGSVPEGHRSLTYRIIYRDPDAAGSPERARTLTDAEVERYQADVVVAAERELGAALRG